MWSFKLSMKVLFLSAILLVSCVQAQNESIELYAERLRDIIVGGDKQGLIDLPCFPSKCVSQYDIEYIFGKGDNDAFVKNFLSQPERKIKIFGPYQYSDRPYSNEYLLMYYDPNLVRFNSEGHLSQDDREKLWWKGYVETVITLKDGEWAFYRAPFYNGTHLPWAEDY